MCSFCRASFAQLDCCDLSVLLPVPVHSAPCRSWAVLFTCITPQFIHSSVEEHLGWSWFLAIMNKAALNTHTEVSGTPVFPFLLGKYLGMKWLGHRAGICLTTWKLLNYFLKRFGYFLFLLEVYEFPSHQYLTRSACSILAVLVGVNGVTSQV